ncbi:MAG: STAS domain-containing protein [Paracoccaceae bacterium]|nr:STAS domain-containing protein [Paracoccaceae bacterium]
MQMSSSTKGDILIITVQDRRIDAAVAVRFKNRMMELADAQSTGRVVLDLGNVDFLDSSGLGAVVGAMKQLGRDRKLDLASLTPTVEKVFRITRMDRVFRIFPDANAAVMDAADAS